VARALDSLARTRYGDSLVIIDWLPYSQDTLNINPGDSLRLSRYQHNSGQPTLVLDGYQAVEMPTDPSEYYEKFDAKIRIVKSTPTYVTLTLSGEADTVECRVIVTLVMDSLMPGSRPILYCVVTEDSLTDLLGPSWDRVPLAFVPTDAGVSVSLARGDTLVDTLTFTTAGHRLDRLGAAVFVEDTIGSKEHPVLQSATISRFVLTEDK
jgi:hypothetical protein